MNGMQPYLPDPASFARMSTAEIRRAFLLDNLFEPGGIRLFSAPVDRAVIGAAVPNARPLALHAPGELASEYFTQRRELGVINIGGPGLVRVEGRDYQLASRDGLYVGRGNRQVEFGSIESGTPALFYLVSYPAHASYPTKQIRQSETESTSFGSATTANRRTIHKYIYAPAVETCQLTMGLTELGEGSVWNTMPVHRHPRRTEIYLYFDLPPEAVVFHYLGEPGETRHIVVRNRQVVLSPGWSIHSGSGTARYAFIWTMGGENREFSDMDAVAMEELA
jgi:4-deoxy-L-threo-5-hexosulose-uronate ketol-isomerase